jgi:hypothetical protein
MTELAEKDFFEKIGTLAEQIQAAANDVLPYYEEFTESVVCGRITDIKRIEYQLDFMLTYCFDDRILSRYTSIPRSWEQQSDRAGTSFRFFRNKDMNIGNSPEA